MVDTASGAPVHHISATRYNGCIAKKTKTSTPQRDTWAKLERAREPALTPDRPVPAVAHHPHPQDPTPPEPRTDEESSRLAKAKIGGAGYFETYGEDDKANLGRRELRRVAKDRLALEAERVASFPQHTYEQGTDQDQRDISDCAAAVGVLNHSKRPYNARRIERLANRFRRTKLGWDAPKVSTAAVLEMVHRQHGLRA